LEKVTHVAHTACEEKAAQAGVKTKAAKRAGDHVAILSSSFKNWPTGASLKHTYEMMYDYSSDDESDHHCAFSIDAVKKNMK